MFTLMFLSTSSLYTIAYLTPIGYDLAIALGILAGRRLNWGKLAAVLFASAGAAYLLAPVVIEILIVLSLLRAIQIGKGREVGCAMIATACWVCCGLGAATTSAVPLMFALARVTAPKELEEEEDEHFIGGLAAGLIPGFAGARTEIEDDDSVITEIAAMTTIALRKKTGITVLSERTSALVEAGDVTLGLALVGGMLLGRLVPKPSEEIERKFSWVGKASVPVIVGGCFLSLPLVTAVATCVLGIALGQLRGGAATFIKTLILFG